MVTEEKETVADMLHIGDLDNSSSDAILLATEADTSIYSPWSKAMFRLYGVLAIAYLCGCLNGFDGSLVRSIILSNWYSSGFLQIGKLWKLALNTRNS